MADSWIEPKTPSCLEIPILGHSAPPCYIIENTKHSDCRLMVDGLAFPILVS